jgi:hypothetical protein
MSADDCNVGFVPIESFANSNRVRRVTNDTGLKGALMQGCRNQLTTHSIAVGEKDPHRAPSFWRFRHSLPRLSGSATPRPSSVKLQSESRCGTAEVQFFTRNVGRRQYGVLCTLSAGNSQYFLCWLWAYRCMSQSTAQILGGKLSSLLLHQFSRHYKERRVQNDHN